MAHASISAPFETPAGKVKITVKALAWAAIVITAVGFVFKYVLFYYRHYGAASFDPYWPRRGWLFLHINGGALALLTGPMQFWTSLRQRNMTVHRWTGRIYLLGSGSWHHRCRGLVPDNNIRFRCGQRDPGLGIGLAGDDGDGVLHDPQKVRVSSQGMDDPVLHRHFCLCDLSIPSRLFTTVPGSS